MAKVTYNARIQVSETEMISLMTIEYPASVFPTWDMSLPVSWSATRISMARQEDGTVLYGPCGERTESYPVSFATHEEALKAGVDAALESLV